MPSTTTGQPATVQSVLPAVKNISSTTHATPIVATTSTAHGLNTGDYFTISGATDPAANGDWRAGTVTSNTVALTVAPTGASSVGTLVGGAVGTLQGRQFGAAITIPSGGDRPSAASVNTPVEALADQAAWLLYSKLNRLGDTATGLISFAGDTEFAANTTNTLRQNATFETEAGSTVIVSGGVEVQSGAIVEVQSGGTVEVLSGGTVEVQSGGTLQMDSGSMDVGLGRKRGRPRIVLSDANHTIDTTQGDEFVLPSTPAGNRTITLQTTTAPVPAEDETITLVHHHSAALGGGFTHTIQREGGTPICTFGLIGGEAHSVTAQFRFSGGVWRLGMNCGMAIYDDGPHTRYGVIPGSGA